MFGNTDRSYIVEEGSDEEVDENGPKPRVLRVHDPKRLILFRHFTEALLRAAYLKHDYDKTKLIENTENMFKKQIQDLFRMLKSNPKDKAHSYFLKSQKQEQVNTPHTTYY